ncbi:PREDICTED: platelet-derived growth factor C [Calidris pugnax]|nr:PREDICTED: platelet-derived growth factor C [Calidris pugnax]
MKEENKLLFSCLEVAAAKTNTDSSGATSVTSSHAPSDAALTASLFYFEQGAPQPVQQQMKSEGQRWPQEVGEGSPGRPANPELEEDQDLLLTVMDGMESLYFKSVQDPQHEKIITVTTNGSIHSPKFPHTYPRNTVLVWRLVAVDENVWIQLTFDERFGLEDPEDDICKYDFVEVEEPSDGTVLGRWCGSSSVPSRQISKGNQIRIRFVSDEYFPSEPGFCIHYTLLMPHHTEAPSPSLLPPSTLPLDVLNNAVAGFSTVEELIRYLEPDRWQLDLEDLYRPTWQLLGKAYIHGRKSRVVDLNLLKEEVRLYSCTPRNFSVSLREELKRTDTIFWPLCLLVKRCGGNCACCHQSCNECQCVPTKVTKKYHEVLQLKPRIGVRGLHKSLTDVPLEHHEECDCVCKGNTEG